MMTERRAICVAVPGPIFTARVTRIRSELAHYCCITGAYNGVSVNNYCFLNLPIIFEPTGFLFVSRVLNNEMNFTVRKSK